MPRVLRNVFPGAWWLVGVLLLVPTAFGQASYTSQVRGIVTDQTGAVVQNALVTITNEGTGIASAGHTDDRGLYTFTGLRPASYTLKVEAQGFQSAERKEIVLQVSQQTTIDFSLKPPGVLATIEVTAATPPLDTESAALGTSVSNEYVRDIPLYNRSIFGLAFLAGGVTETTGSGINDNYPSGTNFVSNGQRNATAQVTLDGSPLSAPEQGEGGNSNVYYQPSVEIVQEFKVQNNGFSAEFGNNGGTVVNIVLKQGTNQFHGSGWWYGQRSATDSRDFFNTGEKPDHVRDQYGFAVGGPVIKNRTFFFVDFEKTRQRDPVNIEGIVPTDLERAGDFSQSPANLPDPENPDTASAGIYDPCAGRVDTDPVCPHAQFPDNKIPDTISPITGKPYIDPIGQAILNLYPHANVEGAVYPNPNFRKVTLATAPAWQFDVKLDHQISDKHKIAGRYSRGHNEYTVPTIVGNGNQGDGVIYLTTVQNGNLEYNWAIKPTALWTSRFSVDRVHAPGISNHYPTLSDVGLPAILNQNGLDRMPAINVGDPFLSMFTQCCVDTAFAHTLYSYSSGLQWVKGPHSIKFGGEQRVFYNNFHQPDNPTGIFNFTRDVTTQNPNAGLGDNNQGNPFATMLLGFPSPEDSTLHIVPSVADKSVDTAFYVQDDWKVTPKLTVNLGLRYEWSSPYTERTNQLQLSDFSGNTGITIPVDRSADPTFDFGQIGNVIGTTVFATSGHRTAPVDRNNFAPRLGFAYQLASNTVVRGGVGTFYGMNVATNYQYAGPSFSKNAPLYFTTDNFATQYATLANPFPAGLAPPQRATYGKLANWGFDNSSDLDTGVARNAEIYQWNLGVQHLLPGQIVVAADYVANRATHLPWAGASVSTRERNFLPSSIRNALVASLNPTHDPDNTAVSDFLGGEVDNPFQCFFAAVASPASYCPAAPIFNAADVADSLYVNPQIPQGLLLRPYPQFTGGFAGLPRLIATSWYNSLQIRFQKRASHYISFEGNYTLAKSTDDSSAGRNAWLTNLEFDNPQLLDDLKAEHGISSNDATHRLTTAFILDLPIGRGRWIGRGMSSVLDAIVGGWSLDSFLTLQSGQPIAIIDSNSRLTDGNQRPDVICSQLRTGISYHEAARTGQPYLNQDCFADPGDNIPGNAPRHFSSLRGDGIRNVDMSLSKEFKIRERAQLQIRAEMFNIANHQRFAFPDNGSGDGSFGTVTETRNNYRRMQFGARVQF